MYELLPVFFACYYLGGHYIDKAFRVRVRVRVRVRISGLYIDKAFNAPERTLTPTLTTNLNPHRDP